MEKTFRSNTGRTANEIAQIIQKTLSEFEIETKIIEAKGGLYSYHFLFWLVNPVQLEAILALEDELKIAITTSTIKIQVPVIGEKLIIITAPVESKFPIVDWYDYQDDQAFLESSPLTVPIGLSEFGEYVYINIVDNPHILMGGTTGGGKSNFFHSTINFLIIRHSPNTLRFILIDPKRVELTLYKNLPHLLTPVIIDSERAAKALSWCIYETDRRYKVLKDTSCQDLSEYHEKVYNPARKQWEINGSSESQVMDLPEPLPYIVVMIDEFSDLMSGYPKEIEKSLVYLSQKSKLAGIHLMISTSRPATDVYTTSIRASFPSRMAFSAASKIDSQTLIGTNGAEQLVGMGHALWRDCSTSNLIEIQIPLLYDTDQIKELISEAINRYNQTDYRVDVLETFNPEVYLDDRTDNDDLLYEQAKNAVLDNGNTSTSYIQHKLNVGYSCAVRLLALLEKRGIIGPAKGSASREVIDN